MQTKAQIITLIVMGILALSIVVLLITTSAMRADNENTTASIATTSPLDQLPISSTQSLSLTVGISQTNLSQLGSTEENAPGPEAYCLWPNDTLSDIALYSGVDGDAIRGFNANFTGNAGSTIHLPAKSIPPAQWTRPGPSVNRIEEIPFGISGYYIGYDNRQKRVALTFDIGYVPENIALMESFAARGIRATFLVMGQSVIRHPRIVADVLDNGHELGNHSYSRENMQALTAEEVRSELSVTEAIVQRAYPGATTKPFFRAPFGAINPTIVDVAKAEGYHVIGWTVDSYDWQENVTSEDVYQRVTQLVCPGAIIAMHDVNHANRNAIPRIIDFLDRNGYEIVPLSEMLFPG